MTSNQVIKFGHFEEPGTHRIHMDPMGPLNIIPHGSLFPMETRRVADGGWEHVVWWQL